MVYNACPLCSGGVDDILYRERLSGAHATDFSARSTSIGETHFRIVRCSGCGLVRSDPIYRPETIHKLYEQSQFLYSDVAGFAAATYRRLFLKSLPSVGSTARILDVGCGNGFFLEALLAAGFDDVWGVEPSVDACAAAPTELGGRIFNEHFPADSLAKGSVDVITSFHLLDHVTDPVAFLCECKTLLKPGGWLLIVCHNERSLSAKILGERSPIYDVEHVFLFNLRTIRALATRAGLSAIRSWPILNSYPLHYWMRYTPLVRGVELPKGLADWPVSLPAGNMALVARAE